MSDACCRTLRDESAPEVSTDEHHVQIIGGVGRNTVCRIIIWRRERSDGRRSTVRVLGNVGRTTVVSHVKIIVTVHGDAARQVHSIRYGAARANAAT